jgi:hypothetical protein
MQNEWEVLFSAEAPIWQYGSLIERLPGPNGAMLPTLACTEVRPQEHGFVRLVVASKGATPELTFLVRQEHVVCAIQLDYLGQGFRWTLPRMK